MSTPPDDPAARRNAPHRHDAHPTASGHSPGRPAPGPQADDDDDPTHALDDFLRRLHPGGTARGHSGHRGAPSADSDPTDLSGLSSILHPEPAAATVSPKAAKGGLLRNGERWQADDVTDVPVLDLPHAPTGAPANAAAQDALLHDIGRQACAAAATAAQAGTHPADDWQPDPQTLHLRHATDPRVLPRWQPGAWIGAHRLVLQASTEFVSAHGHGPAGGIPLAGPVVESHDAQHLLLLWAPPSADAPHPGRWPQHVLLAPMPGPGAGHSAANTQASSAAQTLLNARPAEAADAPLWINPQATDVDWALAAEIALHHLPELRPLQMDGLRAFMDAERELSFARVNDGYGAVPGGAMEKRQ
ncbi:hypothetical protein [Aquabacterium sp. OR-4]|uniref:hypothetical protein n=1 Tax=Aquabacterium sp. OR-4 TaxID=2978127 RepID=UPI0028C88035|nr:hypothetical protein [Aquabacterium sp. OR-4]MDT7838440.1 hypothetical protein [Aquabacterium sp. OR-4]